MSTKEIVTGIDTESKVVTNNFPPSVLTKATGCPIGRLRHSMTCGTNGPVALQDTYLLEKLQYFDREQIPQRNVHAMGTGCYGVLKVTQDISQFSCAKIFSKVGQETPLFVRFSGVFTEKGEADTVRDPRGFAIKFYTEEGNWDLLGINTPVFNVRDSVMGPDAIHAFKRDIRTHEWNTDQLWDYVVNHPESLHQTLMIFTDRVGTPMSYRHMHGYGCNTFSFINSKKERVWIKLHLVCKQGARGLTVEQAKLLAGEDPDFLSRDLREAIQRGDYPQWRLCFQYMSESDGYKNPITFDCTKAWPHSQHPLFEIGTITLNDYPRDYHAEVEQVAFSPANVVPGIGYSPDRLLQGRLFFYDDSQFHRLGPNFKQIPINFPNQVRPQTQYVGGPHQHEIRSKWPHYLGSCYGHFTEHPKYEYPPMACDGPLASYDYIISKDPEIDYYHQPREFYQKVLNEQMKNNLWHNLAINLAKVTDPKIVGLVIGHLCQIDQTLGKAVSRMRDELISGLKLDQGQKLHKELREALSTKKLP